LLKDQKKLEEYVHQYFFPRISESERNYLTKYFTELFSSGWENSGGADATDGGAWTGVSNTPTVVASPVHHGNYACSFDIQPEYCYKTFGSAYTELYMRAYVRLTTMPSANTQEIMLYRFKNAGANQVMAAALNNNGVNTRWGLQYRDNGWQGAASSSQQMNPSVNTWYCVEIHAKIAAGAGVYQMWVNDSELTDITKTGITSDYANMDRVEVGEIYRSAGWTTIVTADCVVVADRRIRCEIPLFHILRGRGGDKRLKTRYCRGYTRPPHY